MKCHAWKWTLSLPSLTIPVRYPGGNFTATYHWLDGVGPKDQRPKRVEAAWKGVETNHFGTDEFMKWCEIIGAQPYIALNMGTGTLEEGKHRFSNSIHLST
jgi:alpha-N-arabinofuranosidase